jgi:hypothetical protein
MMLQVGKLVAGRVYRPVVLEALKAFLSPELFREMPALCRLWRGWELVLTAVLLAWESGGSLAQRFATTGLTLRQWWPKKPLGRTYQGFIKALLRYSPALLETMTGALRTALRATAGPFWQRQGWVAFAVDGSRIECPRTAANEAALGCAGRKKTGPQAFLTTLYHMGTGLPWAFRQGPGTDSERTHLREMAWLLPAGSLLVADAGFIGYDLLAELLGGGRHVLFRVGRNATLLRELGWVVEQRADTVYLWPQAAQRGSRPPLVLRLIMVGQGRHKVYLVTDLPAEALSQEQAEVLYRLRWGVEVFFRSLKQTLEHRRMLSRAPRQALQEVAWSVVGLWLLGLMSMRGLVARGHDPLGLSAALAIRQVRLALRQNRRSVDGQWLAKRLGQALKDRYLRQRPKKARHWPHKKKERPPGAPKVLMATMKQVSLAQRLQGESVAA